MQKTLIQINRNGMGAGDEELGLILIKNYLKLICEETKKPNFIVFYNEGVKLICQNSLVLDELKLLQNLGVKLIACKTCLNHFNLLNNIEVGVAGTMMDIIEIQKVATKVITL